MNSMMLLPDTHTHHTHNVLINGGRSVQEQLLHPVINNEEAR